MSASQPRLRCAVFASGGGSNFQALIDATKDGRLDADLVVCISNRKHAGALEKAHASQIATVVLNPQSTTFSSPTAYTSALLKTLSEHDINFIILAGYMQLIPAPIVSAFRHRILNIHPALLPAYGGRGMYGIHVHKAVLTAGETESGATVHVVTERYDEGPIVLQGRVPVLPDDTPEQLQQRVLRLEHQLYPEAVHLFASGRAKVEGNHVVLT